MRASDLIRFKQSGRPITMLTAWDALSASVVEEAGADIVLVGDSLAMVSLGHTTTLPVTLEQMLLHTQAVCRGLRKPASEQPLVITDLPFLSYQCGLDRAVAAAGHLLKHSSAAGVKLEGAEPEVVEVIERLVRMGIPVMGHLGLTPQSVHQLGYRRQAKDPVSQERLLRQATSLETAGCFAMVLEHVPEALAGRMRRNLQIPVIGIGAGQDCDGQVSVTADLLGLTPRQPPFSPARLDGRTLGIAALRSWLEEQRQPAADPTTAQPPPGSDC
ncbi:3-methyl-2-oxobutanoate hydroxymethyltransferase [Synechococcus sp. PROS-7-1]|uniref:3-methyl-2-oxobutanoate hydroxymethyltransferase n=1 Tax=Synechococcus sp. PROS-7-1 TaxID=1442556 RepID=UPI00164891E1|nr:3-methyl-2-oxobutanoate hydroxymethyltransferase [Synechococcus sp. PROS-7-1]QNI85780.1 3-methyl-2-oxobutanoate hydroxymethyltransferase [Synechococcus sp. PROS-7-1]